MQIHIEADLHYTLEKPTDILLQIEAAAQPDQIIHTQNIEFNDGQSITRIEGKSHIGHRIWLNRERKFRCHYDALVEIKREVPKLETLAAAPLHQLPSDAVCYLMPSTYCPSDDLQNFGDNEFYGLEGGERIAAISQWIYHNIAYVSGASNHFTTAKDTFVMRQGICRDFAHVLIALARASAIPARYVSCYALNVNPQDFHAVAEVFLDGAWHLVDPTGMTKADSTIRIGVGMDASEVAFLHSFGPMWFQSQSIYVDHHTA